MTRYLLACGTRYSYSGDGFILLQFVLERGLGLDAGREFPRMAGYIPDETGAPWDFLYGAGAVARSGYRRSLCSSVSRWICAKAMRTQSGSNTVNVPVGPLPRPAS